ncbi:NtaA/DmoA family FMN-dependent monooxygenase [Rhodobacteraceae bacterium NNCM2]|nr:NtaA/DmoA family FMN-dependent monooxygenase [Coraliihabitans acroporae]
MSQKKHVVLSTLFQTHGSGRAAWLQPEAVPGADTQVEYHIRAAQLCEKAIIDLFFIADTPAARTDNLDLWSKSPMFQNVLEPVTLLSALAVSTKRIGLGATVSTSFFEPYNIARQFASLDHISHGRAAWNVVTSANDYAARNFGLDRLPPHADRYVKAREALELVKAYWDTWEEDAFVYDKANEVLFDPAKFHAVEHEGTYFKVNGGLNIARAPQGHPVIIQAGASEAGKELAAETAEVVFGTGDQIPKAQDFYRDVKGRMAKYGRSTDHLKILQGFAPVVGATEAEARARMEAADARVPIEVRVNAVSNDLETSLRHLPLDEPVPVEIIPEQANHHKAYFEAIAEMIRSGKYTLREIAMRYNRTASVFCGSAEQVADYMQEWMEAEACDGFMLSFRNNPTDLEAFVDLAVPVLQERGLLRRAYEGTTLRDHLGLPKTPNRHAAAKAAE